MGAGEAAEPPSTPLSRPRAAAAGYLAQAAHQRGLTAQDLAQPDTSTPYAFEHAFARLTRWGRGRTGPGPADRGAAGAARRAARCDLAAVREAADHVEPCLRVDGTKVWSLMQLERQLRPESYGRVRGGYLARRRPRATGTVSR
jgi:hypothetical protein